MYVYVQGTLQKGPFYLERVYILWAPPNRSRPRRHVDLPHAITGFSSVTSKEAES